MTRAWRAVLSSWLDRELPAMIHREYDLRLSDQVTALVGPRRAGKTYLLYQTAKGLLDKGFDKENIVYVDFEDIRLKGAGKDDYDDFVKTVFELFRKKDGKIVLLLDEVQNIKDWESWLRTLHNSGDYWLFISGSSSELSSNEVASNLRGRVVSRLVFPFSFKEYLEFKGIKANSIESPEAKGTLLSNLRDYLHFGGFPEVVKSDGEDAKLELLNTYRQTIFYRDVVERFNVRDVSTLDSFTKLVAENFGKQFSLTKTLNYFTSIGVRKSKKTLANYLGYLKEPYFVFTLEKLSYNARDRLNQPVKTYPVDPGFFNLSPRFSKDVGARMESAVASVLYRKSVAAGIDLFYWRDYSQKEVDFVVKNGTKPSELIQATYAASIEEVKAEEKEALDAASEQLHCKKLTVITWDAEGTQNGVTFIPLWKWLLANN